MRPYLPSSSGTPPIRIVLLLLILLITVPLVELTLLLWLSSVTTWYFTLALVIVTGIIGTLVARSQGFSAYRRIQQEYRAGRMPGSAMADAAMIFAAGVLLMTPGLLTDLCGALLLIPPVRRQIKQRMTDWAKRRFHVQEFRPGGQPGSGPTHGSTVIESYIVHDRSDED